MTTMNPLMRARLAGAALKVPVLRDVVLKKVFTQLDESYNRFETDDETLLNARRLAVHSKAFLTRLIRERPAAAQALLRFLTTWVMDMRRRNGGRQTGRVSPCTVVVDPTSRCNLSCPGCYAKSGCDGSDLPYEQLCQVIDQVIEMGVTLVTLSGGEPFLRERSDQAITRLARRYHDRGLLVFTNGTLIDEDIARRLGRAGNVFPAISVEGTARQTDARRGRGISDRNRRTRAMLAEHMVMTGFSATVTRQNAEAICSDSFLDARIDEGDLFGWFFLLQPIGRQPRPDLLVTADQRAMLRETVYRWRREDRPVFLGDFWNDGHLTGGCIAAGKFYFHIRADGSISPCVFTPVTCGNVLNIIEGRSRYTSLREFVEKHPTFAALRQCQRGITDRDRPCMMIDHPEAFRGVFRQGHCIAAMNMPPGYVDGEIAAAIDETAAEWEAKAAQLGPPFEQGDGD